ncbi:MAG: DUF1062 domain-containing protein [Lachnospiraceae bacterium]|nr:DUF1062 domain-containing protein [Lachnospiraceae bacterium]
MSHLLISQQERKDVLKFAAEKIEYRIIPKGAYRIKRNCAGCGEKRDYESTGCFRINANSNRLDVWLIYQCAKCKHTYNLTIYERMRSETLKETEYQSFLENDAETALKYGLDKNLFVRNKAEITSDEVNYQLQKLGDEAIDKLREAKVQLIIHNPYRLKLRTEKVVAEIFAISRSKARKILTGANSKYIGFESIIELEKVMEDKVESGK